MDIGKYLTQSWNLTIKNWAAFVVAAIVLQVLSCITLGILALPLSAGIYLMYLKAAQGKAVKYNEMFACMNRWLGMLGAGILALILISLGLVLVVIPGLIVMTWLMFTLPLMADKNMGAIEAMKASMVMVNKAGILKAFLMLLVTCVIIGAGSSVAWIGSFFTMPLGMGMLAMAYKDKS